MISPISRKPVTLRTQHGTTLLVALVMLILITMLAVSSFNLGKGTMQTVSNMQQRGEVLAAAQETIDVVLSDDTFVTATDGKIFPTPCESGVYNRYCVDTNGDGVVDIKVDVSTPTCAKVKPIANASLNFDDPEDQKCTQGEQTNCGIDGACDGMSMCSQSVWELQAAAVDQVTNAKVTVVQGVGLRVEKSKSDTTCPTS